MREAAKGGKFHLDRNNSHVILTAKFAVVFNEKLNICFCGVWESGKKPERPLPP